MKVTAYIPIKLNNERAPGKNTKQFDDGTPLCQFMFNTISEIKEIEDIFCFCSSREIIPYLSGRVQYLKREAWLDTAKAKCQDIVDAFLNEIETDLIVLIHVTSPFLKKESIEKCVRAVVSGDYDSAFTAARVQDFLWKDGRPLNFNPEYIERTQDLPIVYKESVGCYVFTKDSYLKTRRRIGKKPYICEISKIEEIDIDYPEDFEMANAVYMNVLKNKAVSQDAGEEKNS